MVSRAFFTICFILILQSTAQSFAPDSSIADKEQKQLEACYHFSNLFGYDIESISHPELFDEIGDWMGTKYRYGGNTKKGIDCSGFVSELYKDVFNLKLDGNARDLYARSAPLKKKELCEGDLVFFKIRKKRISHVGIYLGQNKFAHASIKQGITISDLDDPYYKKYFFKGGRLEMKPSVISSVSPKN